MSVSRGKFLKSLGKALPGVALGGGVASAAQAILSKVAPRSEVKQTPQLEAEQKAAKVHFTSSGSPEDKQIALTLDDGPTPGITDRILDELSQRNIRATFFMIGERIAAAPDLARRVLAEGHEIGNHTYTHPKLTDLPDSQVDSEIQRTQDIMGEALNHRPAWFRPPYGVFRQDQARFATSKGLDVVIWSLDPADWAQPGESEIVKRVLAGTKAGSIILCHDVHQQTVNAMGPMLDGLLERGFNFASLSLLPK